MVNITKHSAIIFHLSYIKWSVSPNKSVLYKYRKLLERYEAYEHKGAYQEFKENSSSYYM